MLLQLASGNCLNEWNKKEALILGNIISEVTNQCPTNNKVKLVGSWYYFFAPYLSRIFTIVRMTVFYHLTVTVTVTVHNSSRWDFGIWKENSVFFNFCVKCFSSEKNIDELEITWKKKKELYHKNVDKGLNLKNSSVIN